MSKISLGNNNLEGLFALIFFSSFASVSGRLPRGGSLLRSSTFTRFCVAARTPEPVQSAVALDRRGSTRYPMHVHDVTAVLTGVTLLLEGPRLFWLHRGPCPALSRRMYVGTVSRFFSLLKNTSFGEPSVRSWRGACCSPSVLGVQKIDQNAFLFWARTPHNAFPPPSRIVPSYLRAGTGRIPPELENLHHLQELSLPGNQLFGEGLLCVFSTPRGCRVCRTLVLPVEWFVDIKARYPHPTSRNSVT